MVENSLLNSVTIILVRKGHSGTALVLERAHDPRSAPRDDFICDTPPMKPRPVTITTEGFSWSGLAKTARNGIPTPLKPRLGSHERISHSNPIRPPPHSRPLLPRGARPRSSSPPLLHLFLLSPPSPSPLRSLLHALQSLACTSTLLSLAAVGTRGPTLDELLAVLAPAGGAGATADDVAAFVAHVVGRVLADASAAGGPRISFANGVWVDASLSLKAAFAEITASAYKAEIQSKPRLESSLYDLFFFFFFFLLFDYRDIRTAGAAEIEVESKSFKHAVFVIF
ncbi:Serpin-ZXA [Ananas comosus]|uniref:Serpin-ZXA n=1 Tax=Ananas comosus TaxID=4615 RepID=A0A199UZP5_ANACO|nr:Serpin-ZXA [Ananas comosus]